jgi:serine/threonine-protein phosphatase 2A regulatory subunit B
VDSNNNVSEKATTEAVQRRVFANAHAYNINSISLCSDGQLFLSADDLRVNLWNLESGSECFSKKKATLDHSVDFLHSYCGL